MNVRPLIDVADGNKPYSSLVQRVTVRTTLLPPIVINDPLGQSSGPPSPLMSILKPQITFTSPVLDQPSVRAPYGVPQKNYWPLVQIGLVVGIAALGAGVLFAIRGVRG